MTYRKEYPCMCLKENKHANTIYCMFCPLMVKRFTIRGQVNVLAWEEEWFECCCSNGRTAVCVYECYSPNRVWLLGVTGVKTASLLWRCHRWMWLILALLCQFHYILICKMNNPQDPDQESNKKKHDQNFNSYFRYTQPACGVLPKLIQNCCRSVGNTHKSLLWQRL